ncbi:MAG: HEPN domain-containing protein [Saprospiraceae bacterium]
MSTYKPEDYTNYRLNRAKETLVEVNLLIENKYWNSAVNRLYYASFYAVSAILIKNGVSTLSHSGCRQMFGQLFIHTGKVSTLHGKLYTELFEKRLKGDYGDFFDNDEETVLRLYPATIDFIAAIDKLIL